MNLSKGSKEKQSASRAKQPQRRSVKQERKAAAPVKRTKAQATGAKAASKAKTPAKRSSANASVKRAPAPAPAPARKSAHGGHSKHSSSKSNLFTKIASNRVAMLAFVLVCALAVLGIFDTAANWGKAFGNVSINGLNVAGMTAEEMTDALKSEFASRVSHAQVTVYADEATEQAVQAAQAQASRINDASGEVVDEYSSQDSSELASSFPGVWQVDALSLKASIAYEKAVEQALAAGRANGGVLKRLALLFTSDDIPLEVMFDQELLEAFAQQIDSTFGNPRIDASVVVANGVAQPVEGRAGTMVDRSWLTNMISRAMVRGDAPDAFVAKVSEQQSRISAEQAIDMADAINRAISEGVYFNYRGRSWLASPAVLGEWTNVSIVGEEGNWQLAATIDSSQVVPVIVDKVDLHITSDDMTVSFEKLGSSIEVHTAGSGTIPEVHEAADNLQEVLYGSSGVAWSEHVSEPPTIEIAESNRPEKLSFDDALYLGVINVIGECTTEFTTHMGTENRNHNIQLASEMINGSIVKAHGGTWSFNDVVGDTDEAAGFWTAGSIIDGEIVDSVGGGICQVATTVFNAVLEAGLEVDERHNHTMYMANYPTGRDAAIDYPTGVDLIWSNDLDSDVLLDLIYSDGALTGRIYSVSIGYKVDYKVGDWVEGEKYKTLFEEDESLAEGAYDCKTEGVDGSRIKVTRFVTDKNGASVRMDGFESNYEPTNAVYIIGPNADKDAITKLEDEKREKKKKEKEDKKEEDKKEEDAA